jgi:hypothetical protein
VTETDAAAAEQKKAKFMSILKRVAWAVAAPAVRVSSRADDNDNGKGDSAIANAQKTTFESLVRKREKKKFSKIQRLYFVGHSAVRCSSCPPTASTSRLSTAR